MKYQELIDSCKKAIAEGRCLGCTALENPLFDGNRNCIYGKVQTAEDSIKQIKLNLRNGEKMKYKFEIDERAIGKQRPRYSSKTGRMYTPTATRSFEEKVQFAFLEKYNIEQISYNPIKSRIIIQQKPADSLSKKQKEELIRNIWDCRRPDIDNITKSILDALNGIAYKDDNQICMLYAEKIYGEEDIIYVELEEI